MRITFNIDMRAIRVGAAAGNEFRKCNKKLLWMLESLVKCNGIYLDSHPKTPLLYRAGVVYQRERIGEEEWLDIPNVLQQGSGDCEDLAAWRVAELRKQGIAAKCYLKWRSRAGLTVYHVQVMLPGNVIEDPSKKLGMNGRD